MKNAIKLSENFKINEHAIKLKKGKQLLFRPIYSLRPVELEILKTYIEINLANNFIWFSKSFTKVSILFNQKLNKNFRFYINYQGLIISLSKINICCLWLASC